MNEQDFDNGAKFVPAKCTNCGGELTVDPSQENAVCEYCGASFIVSKAVQNYNVTHNSYTTNVVNDRRKGALEAVLDYKNEQKERKYRMANEARERREAEKKKRNHLILWILGWLFIFPVPLTILMLRNKTLDKRIRYGIIAAGWIVYLIFFFVHRSGSNEAVQTDSSLADTSSVTAAVDVISEAEAVTAAPEESEPGPTETAKKKEDKKDKDSSSEEESKAEEPETSADADEEARKAVNDGDYSLVTPEFKELMDSYEAFYDQYFEFMKKYSSGEVNVMEMLSDYNDMLTQLSEWDDKIDRIDESSLSAADDAYYLLVTLRIEQKLLSSVY